MIKRGVKGDFGGAGRGRKRMEGGYREGGVGQRKRWVSGLFRWVGGNVKRIVLPLQYAIR